MIRTLKTIMMVGSIFTLVSCYVQPSGGVSSLVETGGEGLGGEDVLGGDAEKSALERIEETEVILLTNQDYIGRQAHVYKREHKALKDRKGRRSKACAETVAAVNKAYHATLYYLHRFKDNKTVEDFSVAYLCKVLSSIRLGGFDDVGEVDVASANLSTCLQRGAQNYIKVLVNSCKKRSEPKLTDDDFEPVVANNDSPIDKVNASRTLPSKYQRLGETSAFWFDLIDKRLGSDKGAILAAGCRYFPVMQESTSAAIKAYLQHFDSDDDLEVENYSLALYCSSLSAMAGEHIDSDDGISAKEPSLDTCLAESAHGYIDYFVKLCNKEAINAKQ